MAKKKKGKKKYIFITGGVSSSLGKGLAIASIGALLERRGIKINMLKMDPYINVDPGTMSPIQHGEVFVTDDGAETDLDLGHYERFTSLTLSKKNNFTTGQVYQRVIENEREGKYLGKTVQVVPHITDEIKRKIHLAAEDGELLLAEIGGTIGDIESLPFVESIRQFANDVGLENVLFVHLVLLPYIEAAQEIKTKPAQHSVRDLRSQGLFPNIIICRSDREIEEEQLEKLALFCNVPKEQLFLSPDLDSIYKLPLKLYDQGLDEKICELLGMWTTKPKMDDLKKVSFNVDNPVRKVKIGIIGKYTDLIESYKSLNEALHHGALTNQVQLELVYFDSELMKSAQEVKEALCDLDGILIPGGFGQRGIEGKIMAIEYARVRKVPFLGICLGLQLVLIEFARNVMGIKDATSQEFSDKGSQIIHYMKGQSKALAKGGSMRLGAYGCHIEKGSLAERIYGVTEISERHRHRLEVNNEYREQIMEAGMKISGVNQEYDLVEIVEIEDHPYFIACQYHPEFKSRPFSPHPLFQSFVEHADTYGLKRGKNDV
jgi:CTP synthase